MNDLAHVETMEMAVLGSIIDHPETASSVFETLHPEGFGPRVRVLVEAVSAMTKEGIPLTPELVLDRLRRAGQLRSEHGALIHDCMAHGFAVVDVSWYVSALADMKLSQRLETLGSRVQNAARTTSPESVMDFLGQELVTLRDQVGVRQHHAPTTLADLLLEPEAPDTEWHIPGVIPASDRTMIVGLEGSGKGVMLAQLALSYALGIQPFTMEPLPRPGRALLIEVENSRSQTVRRLRQMLSWATRYPCAGGPENLIVEVRQGGIDLCKPDDQGWFLRLVNDVRPDIISIGPLYRMIGSGDINEEAMHRCWMNVFEPLLERGTSFVIEHHAPHGGEGGKRREMRPVGSSVLRRWFSQGVSLNVMECDAHRSSFCRRCPRVADLNFFRGSREGGTDWPNRVRSPGGNLWWGEASA
ncbi:MAG: hypothetical protein E4H38_05345 [Gemmatimonadales bacterium]|nr:MAG: hypothetical protein E4H38_05345 [Gemmatimonadales bacterium]